VLSTFPAFNKQKQTNINVTLPFSFFLPWSLYRTPTDMNFKPYSYKYMYVRYHRRLEPYTSAAVHDRCDSNYEYYLKSSLYLSAQYLRHVSHPQTIQEPPPHNHHHHRDRFTASSKANSPHGAIQCFLLQIPVYSRFLEVKH